MSVASEITRISNAKDALRTSLNNKGCSIPSSDTIDKYSGYVNNIAGAYIEPNPLTFEALGSGNITWKTNNADWTKSIEYSKDDGETWTTITATTSGVNIAVTTGEKVLIRGNNDAYANDNYAYYCLFVGNVNYYVYGNITDLLPEENRGGLKANCFYGLFRGNTKLRSHDTKDLVLPSFYLGPYCYRCMFYGCTGITRPPVMGNRNLNYSCCYEMFRGCTGLLTAPALPVTEVPGYAYYNMFYGCTHLTAPPALPMTYVGEYACYNMFYNCTSLASWSTLSIKKMGTYGCGYMFQNCTSLTSVQETLPATSLGGSYCYTGMFMGCTSLTAAPALPATTLTSYCYRYMFKNCTALTSAPLLPAATVPTYSYQQMFYGCSSLSTIRCLATDISASNCLTDWVSGVAASGTFYKDSTMTSWPSGASGIPSGWTTTDYSE